MSFFKKLKSQYEIWKINKYTRRRNAMTPDFEQRDPDFYKQNYVNGVYLNTTNNESFHRKSGSISKRHSKPQKIETLSIVICRKRIWK
ncbi:10415_t:CDS:2 [Cetraspora pellucida]|uniref:10415_t:CDS:1 n=1 Tax=Cetraspora pellucida TaxID=1433469 RepID=A0A9N8ZUC2_9GLOM|nr:10415_t:CDS:2 [Cetraspora pellucida]